MHRFSRMQLSPEVALRIAVLAVIDHRRDYLAAGYSCMLAFCTGRLHMSEDKALRRIQVARAALRFPELFEYLADGRLSVSTASVLAPKLEPESAAELLAASAFEPRQAILRLLAERSRAVPGLLAVASDEPPVQDTSGSPAPGQVNELSDLCATPACNAEAASPAPGRVDNPRRGRVSASANGGHEVRLSITDQEHDDLRRAQALLGHAVPSGDPALVYARAMKLYVAHLEKQRFGVKRSAASSTSDAAAVSPAPEQVDHVRCGRGIPKAMRGLVWERDGGRCAFVSADGHRCGSTQRLELDHIAPLALGGGNTPENLRVLCRAHNQYEAERLLGKDHIQTRRELAQCERARAKAAAAACAKRAKTRDPARQARHDDIYGALSGLGFKVAQAKLGAETADAMPEASLEACVRHALTVLSRPLAMRGERRARCTA